MERVVFKGILFLTWILPYIGLSQVEIPPLERSVSVTFSGQSSQECLKVIEVKGDFYFGYRTNLIPDNDHVARSYVDKTVREILDDLFQLRLSYRQKGNYILLRPAPVLKAKEILISGYIYDITSQEKLAYSSVYDSVTLVSALSDGFGHYSIKLEKAQTLRLNVKKQGYHDTTFVWDGKESTVIDVAMRPIVQPIEEDTTKAGRYNFLKLSLEQKAILNNFKDKLKGKVQFSLIPNVGTNGKLSSVTDVDYSVNLFGGFNRSVKKAEISAFFNMNYDTVQYFQAAGLVNLTGGYQQGVQLAGFTNLNNDGFKGVQAAGFVSLTKKDFYGFQGSGFVNSVLGATTGMQAAGFANFTNRADKALQLAGFGNFAVNDFQGMQIAGFGNYAGNQSNGVQLAGALNVSHGLYKGTQISGLLNVADNIRGYQVGIFNYSDSIQGAAFGFLSFSRKGLHQLELSTNEMTYGNVSFRTGTNQFYNIISAGSRFDKAMTWSFGYGIGSSVRSGSKGRIFFDLFGSSIVQGADVNNSAILGKFTFNYQYAFGDKFALAIGPSYNVYLTQGTTDLQGDSMRQLAPYSFYSSPASGNTVQMWAGGMLALRFF